MTLSIVILAAGKGKRMYSEFPKILHKIAGKSLLEHVVKSAEKAAPSAKIVVVYGHQGELVKHTLASLNVIWVEQPEQLGTADALQRALPLITETERVLVLYGDVPLISSDTLKDFITKTPENTLGMITATLENPQGLGRIIRDIQHNITHIVEEKDATDIERAISEINSGIYLIPVKFLETWLPKIKNHNSQQEFYLTDIIQHATKEKIAIFSMHPHQTEEIAGINDRMQLAKAERFYQLQQAKKFMQQGVTFLDPERFDLRGELTIEKDVVIDINVILEGTIKIGHHCHIGPNVFLRNVTLGDRVEIKANSVLEGSEVAADCIIGPFARLRPGTQLAAHSHIGNFVEIKNSFIGEYTKVNHLSYIGDSEVGEKVNIGAGTITCNYDGINKHKTLIGDQVFIGSNTSLIAPVIIHEKATIGAGSVITRDAPANQLTLCRAEQRTVQNWQRPKKKEKEI